MTTTQSVTDFITRTQLSDLTASAIARAKWSVLDGFGLAVAGSVSEPSRLAREYLAELGAGPELRSRIAGSGDQSHPRFAAFANGIAIHADDFDDTQLAVSPDRVYGLLTHPTAPVLAAVLAVADQLDLQGELLLRGYAVGVEVATKVAEAIYPRHYEDGFHSTGTAGTIGAAAGLCNMLSVDNPTSARALGLAASQAAGLRENFGTMTKPFHAGRAAESAVVAVDLARRGWTAACDVLEASRGFFRAAGGGYDPALIDDVLGAPWTFDEPGISIKPFPSGSLTHPAMCALAELRKEHGLRPEDIDEIYVGTNKHMPTALIHHQPADSLQAKFSMEYCMAIVAIEDEVGLPQFTDERVVAPDVQEMLKRVDFAGDPSIDVDYNLMNTIVRVRTKDGRTLQSLAQFAKGSPAMPLSREELVGKFVSNMRWGGITDEASHDRLVTRVDAIETWPSVRDLVDDLVISGG
jgi:2-methylcitrate dehydratase PrpD